MSSSNSRQRIFNISPVKTNVGQTSKLVQPQKINEKYTFSFETMPRVNCLYHIDQFITMFCRSPTCQMPLCPTVKVMYIQCVKIHLQEHQSYNSYGDLDTFENCLTETYHSLAVHCNQFTDQINNLARIAGSNNIQTHMDKVKQARLQCHQLVDNFFNSLEADLATELEHNLQYLQQQALNFQKYLSSRWKNQMGFLEKLNTDKSVKCLVKYFSTNFERENMDYFHEAEQFNKQLELHTPDVIVDENGLYQFKIDLARFVSLKSFAPTKKPLRQSVDYNYSNELPPHQSSQKQFAKSTEQSRQQDYPVKPMNFMPATAPIETTTSKIHPYLRTPPKANNYYENK